MSMSKKDYETIAQVLQDERRQAVREDHFDVANETISLIEARLCLVFKSQNPRFDPVKFKEVAALSEARPVPHQRR